MCKLAFAALLALAMGFTISAGRDGLECIDTSTGQQVPMSYCTGET